VAAKRSRVRKALMALVVAVAVVVVGLSPLKGRYNRADARASSSSF